MQKKVEITFKSKVDEMELEFLYDGLLIEDEHKILRYTEEIDNRSVDTSVVLEDTIIINRSNGVEMYQEFAVGESTVMDYSVGGLSFNIIVNTESIINENNYLKVVYSTEVGETVQNHEIEIYYS